MKTSNTPLTLRTEELVRLIFPDPAVRQQARRKLIERCGNALPLSEHSTAQALERLRFAALKLSRGSFAELDEAVELANVDWRDVLVAAGFGSKLDAHDEWFAAVVQQTNRSEQMDGKDSE